MASLSSAATARATSATAVEDEVEADVARSDNALDSGICLSELSCGGGAMASLSSAATTRATSATIANPDANVGVAFNKEDEASWQMDMEEQGGPWDMPAIDAAEEGPEALERKLGEAEAEAHAEE